MIRRRHRHGWRRFEPRGADRRDGQVVEHQDHAGLALGIDLDAVDQILQALHRGAEAAAQALRLGRGLLALGSPLHGLFAETLGKDTGLSKGMGGSMHAFFPPFGAYPNNAIVGGSAARGVVVVSVSVPSVAVTDAVRLIVPAKSAGGVNVSPASCAGVRPTPR